MLAATLTAAEPPPLLTEFFLGIRPAVVALILAAAIGIGKKVLVDRFNIILAAVALGVSLVSNAHPGILIVSAAIFGYLHQQLLSRGGARP